MRVVYVTIACSRTLLVQERVTAGVSCRQFGTVRIKFKLVTYIQETVADR